MVGSYVTLNKPHCVSKPSSVKGGGDGVELAFGRHEEFPVDEGTIRSGLVTAPSVKPEWLSTEATNVVPAAKGRKVTQTPAFCTARSGIGMDKGEVELKGMTVNDSGKLSAWGTSTKVTVSGPHCSMGESEKENETTC